MKITLIAKIYTAAFPKQELEDLAEQAWPEIENKISSWIENEFLYQMEDEKSMAEVLNENFADFLDNLMSYISDSYWGAHPKILGLIDYLEGDTENNKNAFWEYFIQRKVVTYLYQKYLNQNAPLDYLDRLSDLEDYE